MIVAHQIPLDRQELKRNHDYFGCVIVELNRMAENGDPEAQYMMARIRSGGWGILESEPEAQRWAKRAFGNFCKRKDAKARRYSVLLHYWDLGVPDDDVAEIKWLREQADAGNVFAEYRLGEIYGELSSHTKGVHSNKQDNKMEAGKWYLRVAERGHVEAQYRIGLMYEYTEGFKDEAKALYWLEEAARAGHVAAMTSLQLAYGELGNQKAAIKWLTEAAKAGDTRSQYRLAQTYYSGHEVACDYDQAFRWCELAAKANLAPAQDMLGDMYQQGSGTRVDYRQAAHWYKLSALQGFTPAHRGLARMYFEGQGVLKDYVQAYAWAILAAVDGGESYVQLRDSIEDKMSPEQIGEGQARAKALREQIRKVNPMF